MKPAVINWDNGKPVVHLPKGIKLSNKFTLEQSRDVTVRTLLLDGDQNTKLSKSNKAQTKYRTFGISLAPHKQAGIGNMCAFASPACIDACLDGSGMRSVWEAIHIGKIARTVAYQTERQWFLDRLAQELTNKQRAADDNGYTIAVRPNVLSDTPWETTGIVDDFPRIQWYDYTKNPKRAGLLRPNYWVTFSRSETNQRATMQTLRNGNNVAVVFASSLGRRFTYLPETYKGFDVIDGDETDLRFLDRRGVVVGLKLKTATNREYSAASASGFPVMVN